MNKKKVAKIAIGLLIAGFIGSCVEVKEPKNATVKPVAQKVEMKKDISIEKFIKEIDTVNVVEVVNAIKENKYLLIKIKNTTEDKRCIELNCFNVLKKLKDHKDFKNIDKIGIMVMADFNDKYGKTFEAKSFQGTFKRSELDKINWNNFTFKDILGVADETWFHKLVN